MAKIKDQISANSTPLLVLLLVVAAFFIGRLSSQVETLKNGGTTVVPTQAAGDQQAAPTITMDTIRGLFEQDITVFGDKNEKVVFVDVSDPSCPYCHIAAGKNRELNNQDPRFKLKADGGTYEAPVAEMKKLLDKGDIAYLWIYDNGHGNGEMGAKALWCADEKGKFWDVHEKLFSAEGYTMLNETVQNDVTKAGVLAEFLKGAVDKSFMESCVSSDKYTARLGSNIQLAQSLGVTGTPGFFVNTVFYPGAVSFTDGMGSTVSQELGK